MMFPVAADSAITPRTQQFRGLSTKTTTQIGPGFLRESLTSLSMTLRVKNSVLIDRLQVRVRRRPAS